MAISPTLSSNQAFLTSKAPIAHEQERSTPLLDEAACKISDVSHGVISFEKDLDGTFSSMPVNTIPTTSLSQIPTAYEQSLADANTFDFWAPLKSDIRREAQSGTFLELISKRRKELSIQKETWRKFINDHSRVEDPSFYASIDEVVDEGRLSLINLGYNASYYLSDAMGNCRYVIRPVDENFCCLNHRYHQGSPFHDNARDHRIREHIPLYRSAQTDAFCSTFASLCGIGSITPKTVMHVISSENYYDISSLLLGKGRDRFLLSTGSPDQEKLCSVRELVPNSESLRSAQQHSKDYDQKDLEEVSLFIWLTGDTMAGSNNVLAYVKLVDSNGKRIYGLKKIDNTLSFPEKNGGFFTNVSNFPNVHLPLSKEIIAKISSIPTKQILKKMDDYQLGNAKDAFTERVSIIQELAQRQEITIEEIYFRFRLLGTKNEPLALSTHSLSELERILYK